MKRLSIITINRNNAEGLRKTIESVVNQTAFDQIEYIVIDGASTDGSKEVIEEYAGKLAFWVSEPDQGIYNAMNKGIKVATGVYCQFLNSGDWLVDKEVIKDMMDELPDCYIFLGNVINVFTNGTKRFEKHSKEISMLTFYYSTLQHASALIKRSLFDTYGLYDEELKIVSDWKWYLEVVGLRSVNVKFTDRYVCYFDKTGISSTLLTLDKKERRKVLEELIPESILADYDKFGFDIIQMQRLKKYPLIYKFVWFIERVLFKMEKWKNRFYN